MMNNNTFIISNNQSLCGDEQECLRASITEVPSRTTDDA